MKHRILNREIEVRSFMNSKLLWIGIGFELLVDGEVVSRSRDRIEGFKANLEATVEMDGESKRIVLITAFPASALRTGYTISVDGQEVATGWVRSRNWYMIYSLLVLSVLLLVLMVTLRAKLAEKVDCTELPICIPNGLETRVAGLWRRDDQNYRLQDSAAIRDFAHMDAVALDAS